MPLIPIDQLIEIPEGITIKPELLEIADLSTIPRDTTMLTMLGSLKVLIRQEDQLLLIKVVRNIHPDDKLVTIYGATRVALAMGDATALVPEDPVEAQRLPKLKSSRLTLPDEVYWKFALPLNSTGAQVLNAVRASDEFIMKTTEALLRQGAYR